MTAATGHQRQGGVSGLFDSGCWGALPDHQIGPLKLPRGISRSSVPGSSPWFGSDFLQLGVPIDRGDGTPGGGRMLLQRPANVIRGTVGDTSECSDRGHAVAKVVVEEC